MNIKTFKTNIPNLEIFIDTNDIVIKSNNELECLSNAAINGGRVKTKSIVNHHVPLDFGYTSLEDVFTPVKQKFNLSNSVIGLLTAVKMNNAVIMNEKIDDIDYIVAITAGLSNLIAPDIEDVQDIKESDNTKFKPGTINIILIFNCKFAEYAMVNLFITITEVKTLLLNKFNVRMKNGILATGTSTDTIAIGFTDKGQLIKWSGFATKFGQSIGKSVFKTLDMALSKGGWI
ncbi:MAG: adenosylcobinamide amidohydrolase [Promethearchaeota archaeon]